MWKDPEWTAFPYTVDLMHAMEPGNDPKQRWLYAVQYDVPRARNGHPVDADIARWKCDRGKYFTPMSSLADRARWLWLSVRGHSHWSEADAKSDCDTCQVPTFTYAAISSGLVTYKMKHAQTSFKHSMQDGRKDLTCVYIPLINNMRWCHGISISKCGPLITMPCGSECHENNFQTITLKEVYKVGAIFMLFHSPCSSCGLKSLG